MGPTDTTNKEETVTTFELPENLKAEIDEGVEATAKEAEQEAAEMSGQAEPDKKEGDEEEEEEGKESTTDQKADETSESDEEESEETADDKPRESEDEEEEEPAKKDEGEPPALSDEALTRAVKAGMTLADARTFANEDTLGRFVGMLEERANDGEGDNDEGDGDEEGKKGDSENEDDPLADLPDLDPDEVAPEIATAFNGLKKIAQQQQETITSLRGEDKGATDEGKESAGQPTEQQVQEGTKWFDSQVNNLGEDYKAVLGEGDISSLKEGSQEFANRQKVAQRMQMLAAGYESVGEQVTPDALFQEAVEKVFSETKKQLASRSKTHTQRPGRNKTKPKASAEDEIASELNDKYFNE